MVMRALPLPVWRRLLSLVACVCLFTGAAVCNARTQPSSALAQATEAACNKQIVLIGEADHGDGATVEFKAALVQNLISDCGFNALYFEAGTYDFLKVEEMVRARRPVDDATLASAIGALWNQDEEIAQLVGFLMPRVNSGQVHVGGIDDQVGAVGAFYSLEQMPVDLAAVLPPPRRNGCQDHIRRRANYDYSDEHPHDVAAIADVDRCLADVQQRLAPAARRGDRLAADRLQMATEFRRAISRDFLAIADLVTRRDWGMYQDLRWLMDHAGSHRKTIIWTANAHAAKSPWVSGDYDKGPNLGTLVHRAFGSRAFALSISAAGGSHYWSRTERSRQIPPAAPDSIEARALAAHGEDAVYVPAAQLRKLGVAPASFDRHKPRREQWDQIFDGALILKSERPPVRKQ